MAPRPLPPAPSVLVGAAGVFSSSLVGAGVVGSGSPAAAVVSDMAKACCKMASSVISTSPSASFPSSAADAAASASFPAPAPSADFMSTSPGTWLPSALPPSLGASAAVVAPPSSCCCCSLSLWAWASCLALSSSMLTRKAKASSGSRFGSTPNSKSLAPPPPPPPPMPPIPLLPPSLSPMKTGVLSRMSLRMVPGGTVTRWLLSFEFTAAKKASNFSAFFSAASSPKLTISMDTLFFFSFFATFTRAFSSSSSGDPMNATILCLWFLFCLCFRASWAIWTPWIRLTLPSGFIFCMQERTLPRSGVGVAKT
mmetsp:Transcript_5218/g.15680  ORF Transcript_5218/g.15680 Transcript_5218/m.15680 type:complete len:311 (-) Transcript_5218:475-1407(-)